MISPKGAKYPNTGCFRFLDPHGSKYIIIPTLGPKVYKYDLLWATWSTRGLGTVIMVWSRYLVFGYLDPSSTCFKQDR